jgi:hypothetical protein
MVPMALFALTVIGTHKPASTHAPTCKHARADEPRHKHAHCVCLWMFPLDSILCRGALISARACQSMSLPSYSTFSCERLPCRSTMK